MRDAKRSRPQPELEVQMRYVILWALGVPITALIVLHLFGVL